MFKYNNVQLETGVGMIMMYGGPYNKDINGWLYCDGSAINRTTYNNLFTVIGTTYGAGDGSSTFNIPDLTGKFIAGSSSMSSVNVKGGEEKHTILSTELPPHSHGSTTTAGINENHTHTYSSGSALGTKTRGGDHVYGPRQGTGDDSTWGTSSTNVNHSHTFTTDNFGKSDPVVPVSSIPPYVGVCFIIKY